MDILVEAVSGIWPGRKGTSVTALQDFSYHFRSGRFTCLLGPSGCGKSTLIQIMGGIEDATSGSVRVVDPALSSRARPLGRDSVMVWQTLKLFPWRNVLDNVAFGLEMQGMPRAQRYAKARALLASVGLCHRRILAAHDRGRLHGL